MRRVLLLSALGLIGCSAAKADPSPDLAARPRIELRTVKQNFGTIIGAYVRDNEIGEPSRFVEYTATETAAEQSVTPSFPLITAPTLGQCAPCEVGNPDHCGGDPARCYKVANTPGSTGCCL